MEFTNDTIGEFMDSRCELYNDNESLIFPAKRERYTFGEFKKLYDSVAKGLLSLGVKKGEHIALLSFNSPLWIALQIASAKIGVVLVCINTGYRENELEYVLQHSETTTLLLTSGHESNNFLENLEAICPEIVNSNPGKICSAKLSKLKNVIMLDDTVSAGTYTLDELIASGNNITDIELNEATEKVNCKDIANIYYTSGTTGKPKAVMLSHFSIINNAVESGRKLNFDGNDRLLLCLPLFHVIGYVLSAFASLIIGAAVIISEKFETEKVIKYIESEKCTVFNGVPTMFKLMINCERFEKYDLTSIRKGFIAGSYCPPDLIIEINQKFHMCLLNVYGQTEAIAIAQTTAADSLEIRTNSIGRPIAGIVPHIVDPVSGEELSCNLEGELCIDTAYIMNGYYKNKDATEKAIDKNGWLHTGDLALIDSNGYITLKGRIKDIIIRGGENIAPTEVESVICKINGVIDAALVGIQDDVMGEEACAFIICDEYTSLTAESVKEYIKSHLARFKVPKYTEFVKKFPVTSSGKVQKFVLREYFLKKYNMTQNKTI